MLPFPADSAEFEEYAAAMESMADAADALPEPEPENFGGRCEDAPCCGCCGHDSEPEDYDHHDYANDEPEDYDSQAEDEAYWASMENRDDPEDRYLDSYWEDMNECGMEGCCGDF